jgi:hypothetical protein
MTARGILFSATEWTFRTGALREARAAVVTRAPRREQALNQARLLLEIARRVKYPVESLPKGARAGVLLGLYRDAIYWAMAAARPGDDAPPADLPALWAELPADDLARAAGGTAALETTQRTLFETPATRTFDLEPADVAQVGALATALIGKLDAARDRTNRLIEQRWLRVLLILALVVGLGALIRHRVLGANLASDVQVRTSTSWAGCASDPPCGALLFHTDPEMNPWVELDLGKAKTIRRVEVTNRTDCCSERAVPLVVEASTDHVTWSPLGRRETDFTSWTLTFAPRLARYVKLHVPRNTAFHLKDVVIR